MEAPCCQEEEEEEVEEEELLLCELMQIYFDIENITFIIHYFWATQLMPLEQKH